MNREITIKKSKKGIKYSKSADKALTFEELEYLQYNINNIRERIILIGLAFAGLRIGELVQCRKDWLRWDVLDSGDKKKRVLAIDIPSQDRNILNKYMLWTPKTKTERTTYILDELLSQTFFDYYMNNNNGISSEFETKNLLHLNRNISVYIVGTKFLKYLYKYHKQKYYEEHKQEIDIDKLKKIRSKLSAHPLRSTYENLLFYKYKVSIDVASSILGHSEDIAKKHYVSKSRSNIKNKLAQEILK